MKYEKALEKVKKFIESKFDKQPKDSKPILYIDGRYGVGKSYLGNQIINLYNFKKKCENDRKIAKFVRCTHFKISLAGAKDIDDINKNMTKGIKSLFSILSLVLFIIIGFVPLFIKRIFTKNNEKDFTVKLFSLLKFKSLFNRVIIVVDELDRKCDCLDLNGVFAVLSAMATRNVRIIIIGDTNGIINNVERLKTISYRDKICTEVITITEPSNEIIKDYDFLHRFPKARFPRINDITKNIRVVSKAEQTFKLITRKLNNQQKHAVEYILLSYYQNLEDGYFYKEKQRRLNPVSAQNQSSTVLVPYKYYYALNEYLKRQFVFDESIIFVLISDGTFNIRQIPIINEILMSTVNLDEINIGGRFNAIPLNDATFNKNVLSAINNVRNLTTNNPLITEFTCDLFFCYCASNISRQFINGLSKFQYPIDFRGFIPKNTQNTTVNMQNRIGFVQYSNLE